MKEIHGIYASLLEVSAADLVRLQSRSRLISVLRLTTFVAIVVCGVMGVRTAAADGSATLWFAGGAVFVVCFALMVRWQAQVEVSRSRADATNNALQLEMRALAGDYSGFDAGEMPDADHPFAADLDVFGDNGMYRQINRCSSAPGKALMHQHLSSPALRVSDWPQWHEALKSLALSHKERIAFIASAQSAAGDERAWNLLKTWSKGGGTSLFQGGWIRALLILAPIYSLAMLMLYAYERIGDRGLLLAFLLPLAVSGIFFKASSKLYADLSKQTDFLKSLSYFMASARSLPSDSMLVSAAQNELKTAEAAAEALGRIVSAYDQRNNIFAALVTNALYMADVRNARRATLWRLQYGDQVSGWIDALARLEVLVSLAQFTARHGDHLVFPRVQNEAGVKALSMLHPLMLHQNMVPNNAELHAEQHVALITGANMAGKSTYLRSLGLNVLLAKMGAPVAATEFQMSDLRLFTSMRTTDSLATGTSYFMAELRRLSALMNAVSGDPPLLVLLDEILKGTNSSDKEAGSRAFVVKLLQLKVLTVVATHDVSLCTLSKDYSAVVNLHFSAEIGQNDLHFDYRMKAGVCDTMNATWLMRKMGLIDDIPELKA